MEIMIDTYVSVVETDEYITSHYRSNNVNRTRWEALSESDKEVILVKACAEIEILPFIGRKAVRDQIMAFPRLPMQYGKTEEGAPKRVKHAQIELALWLSDEDKQNKQSKRKELQEQGVTSFSIGDLSESYSEVPVKQGAYRYAKSMTLLSPYLNGGFGTC